jgi:hypothetical protein
MKALKAFALPRPRNRIKAAYITRCRQISTDPTKRRNEVVVDEKKPKGFSEEHVMRLLCKKYKKTIESFRLYWCLIALLTSLAVVSSVGRDLIGPG